VVLDTTLCVCLLGGVKRHFQQYFSYIVAVSFIDGGQVGCFLQVIPFPPPIKLTAKVSQ
jgi:hypothetical protein